MVTHEAIYQRLKLIERGRRELGRILTKNRRILTKNRCILTKNRCIPLASIIEKISEKVCSRSLRKKIKHLGFGNHVASKMPFLTEKLKANKLAFARKYQTWSLSD